MTSIPPTPLEKLIAYRLQCYELGKAYDENKIRRVIDAWWTEKGGNDAQLLGEVDNPEILTEEPARARAIRMDDREAMRELEKQQVSARQQISAANSQKSLDQLKDDRIAELERQLAAKIARPPKAEKPVAIPTPTIPAPDGTPDITWPKATLVEYAKERGYELPKNLQFASKAVMLELVLAGDAAAQPVAEAVGA